jgi:hypothetical protein
MAGSVLNQTLGIIINISAKSNFSASKTGTSPSSNHWRWYAILKTWTEIIKKWQHTDLKIESFLYYWYLCFLHLVTDRPQQT